MAVQAIIVVVVEPGGSHGRGACDTVVVVSLIPVSWPRGIDVIHWL
jgi:hypothetical protein